MSWFDRWFKRYRIPNTRQFPRLLASWPIKCEIPTKIQGVFVSTTKDIGAGGAAVIAREILGVGSRVQVGIYVPPLNRTIQAEAQVVRCVQRGGGFEWGLRFLQISPEDRQVLKETVEQFYGSKEWARHHGRWWRQVP